MIRVVRWVLLPVSLIYQLIVWLRNLLYDRGILQSRFFDIPTIVVGNLVVGGAGKSPMTEYLIRLLSDGYRVATLSRGYGRKTKGFREVQVSSLVSEVGDEPLQFKRKFPDITVAVSENRCIGIDQLQDDHDLVILDDAYQHRRLKPGFSMLLFDFASLQEPRLTLPTGNYRDNFSAIKRADLIVVTKCPRSMDIPRQKSIENRMRKYGTAPLFYTAIGDDKPLDVYLRTLETDLINMDIVLFCGIAKPQPLIDHLEAQGNRVRSIIFPDHYPFSDEDYEGIVAKFHAIVSESKIILTTEKDFQRIDLQQFTGLSLFYMPIHLEFVHSSRELFDKTIQDYVSRQRNVNKP
jgi:tetraacyldisaccharide 4'-kinase